MTCNAIIAISCNGKDCDDEFSTGAADFAEARKEAEPYGWTFVPAMKGVHAMDFCKRCSAMRSRRETST